jgi:hypothetical protein
MEQEIWKPIEGYEQYYEVSTFGRVRSCDRIITDTNNVQFNHKGRLLKAAANRDGYLQVALSRNNKLETFLVHRLVGLAFIPNPAEKYTVNHKDGVKSNCNVDNLEWATKSEQTIHALANNLRTMPNVWGGVTGSEHGAAKVVQQYDKHGNFITEFGSIVEASNHTGISASCITGVCKGRHKTSGGFIWKHKL